MPHETGEPRDLGLGFRKRVCLLVGNHLKTVLDPPQIAVGGDKIVAGLCIDASALGQRL